MKGVSLLVPAISAFSFQQGLAVSMALWTIEPAIRTIMAFGELFHQGVVIAYTKLYFTPITDFTSESSYANVGNTFVSLLEVEKQELLDENKQRLSCIVEEFNKNAFELKWMEKVKIEKQEDVFQENLLKESLPVVAEALEVKIILDTNNFQKYSQLFSEVVADGCSVGEEYFLPGQYQLEVQQLLVDYLKGQKIDLSQFKLSDQILQDLAKIAAHLKLSDLEAKITLKVVEEVKCLRIIDLDGLQAFLGNYGELINYGEYQNDFHGLLQEIKEFKAGFYQKCLDEELDSLYFEAEKALDIFAVYFLVTLLFLPLGFTVPYLTWANTLSAGPQAVLGAVWGFSSLLSSALFGSAGNELFPVTYQAVENFFSSICNVLIATVSATARVVHKIALYHL